MLNFDITIPDLSPVAAGKRATTLIPTGPTYREITVLYSPEGTKATKAVMIADIEEVVLKINGTARVAISGKHLVMLNEYYGNTFADGELVIPLSRHWMRTKEGEENLCWGTQNVQNFILEVKLASGATDPELSVDCQIVPESRELGAIVEIHDYSFDSSTTGKKEISSLPTENGSLFAMHLENANITALEGKVNRAIFVDDGIDLTAFQNRIARRGDRTLQSGYVHVDPVASNRIEDALPLAGATDFRVNPTLSSAGSIEILMETISAPLGLNA